MGESSQHEAENHGKKERSGGWGLKASKMTAIYRLHITRKIT